MKKAILILVVFLQIAAYSQTTIPDSLSKFQYLTKLLDSTRKVKVDSLRVDLNSQFYKLLYDVVSDHSFVTDSIKGLKIGQTASSDGQLIFYNWNIQQNDGMNLYNGIIYLPPTHKVIALAIKPSEMRVNQDSIYAPNDWPAGLYYKIISPRKKNDKYYVLFSWDRFSHQTSRKTIDALTITGDSSIVFGKEVFKTKAGRLKRVNIEYASTANLTLKYSKQKLTLKGVRKSQSKVNDSIIVVDRLAPLNEELKGIRWAYVPVGNIYDGYVYFKDYWTFVEGISARNPAVKSDNKKKKKKPDLDLIPREK